MNDDFSRYELFEHRLKEKHPAMFSQPYGGICIGEGWWEIIEFLCGHIDSYTKWKNKTREALMNSNPYAHKIPEAVPQVVVMQIKEKFGGLRFYYEGGDDYVRGLVTMAESWAAHSCEECGDPGVSRQGGWIKTLCDKHHEARQQKYQKEAV